MGRVDSVCAVHEIVLHMISTSIPTATASVLDARNAFAVLAHPNAVPEKRLHYVSPA